MSGQILVDILPVETDLSDLDPSLFDLDRGSTVIIIVMSHIEWCCVQKVWISITVFSVSRALYRAGIGCPRGAGLICGAEKFRISCVQRGLNLKEGHNLVTTVECAEREMIKISSRAVQVLNFVCAVSFRV